MECSVYFYRGPWTIALSVQFAFRPTQLGMSFFSVVRKLNTYLKATHIGLKSFIMDNSYLQTTRKEKNLLLGMLKRQTGGFLLKSQVG